MSHSTQNRERAVQLITRRNMLQRRIKQTQKQLAALEGEARQALEVSLRTDQAALAEMIPTLEALQADFRQDEERIRRKTQEAIRLKAEWQSRQFPNYLPGGSVPPNPGQILGFLAILAAMAAIVGGVLLLLNK
jgi:multidrug efflux pump subunit AcrA (membrane-fusion protein)